MKKALKYLSIPLAFAAEEASAQFPFYSGTMNPHTYAMQFNYRLQDKDLQILGVMKTSRKEIPLWGYGGFDIQKQTNLLFGVGPHIDLDRVEIIPTIESYGKDIGGTIYTTIFPGKDYFIDVNPVFDNKLNLDAVYANLGKNFGKGFHGAISNNYKDGKFGRLEDTDLRCAYIKDGSFIEGLVNFGKKKVRVSVQRAL